MKLDNTKNKVIAGVVTIGVILAGYLTYEHFAYVTTDNAQIFGHSLMLSPKVTGFINEVKVVEGQKVAKGDVLISIDPRDYNNNVNQVKGDLGSIEARRRDAEKNYRRQLDLLAKGVVSQQQLDSASAAYNDVKAKYDAIASQVNQAELNLSYAKIVAPADGFIAKKSGEVGQLATPGVPLIGFVDSGERWVIANFKETEVEDIKIDAKVEIEVDAISSKKFVGKVESISSATGATFTLLPPDNATGNFTKVVQRVPVKIKFENVTDKDIEMLRNGLSAYIKVHKK
ncbi:MAG: HlyD family secretion protein [Bacteriovorax sp.]|nr:HlyD family secretion protein [Bacteriovorax sp.]